MRQQASNLRPPLVVALQPLLYGGHPLLQLL
jgi:hypothetical protein